MNGGLCEDFIGQYLCHCPFGYRGNSCEEADGDDTVRFHRAPVSNGNILSLLEHDYCDSMPCKNGANCINSTDNYHCTCRQGFDGTNCDNGEKTLSSVIRSSK